MDEGILTESIDSAEKAESLSPDEFVYRLCLIGSRDRKNKEIPALNNFEPTNRDKLDGISVDAANLTSPEMSLAILGAQYKKNTTEFKDFSTREIYPLLTGYILKLPKIKDVIHNPIYINDPPIGSPNNKAHSLIRFTSFDFEDTPELILKMRDHAVSNGKVHVNMAEVEKIALELREHPNNA